MHKRLYKDYDLGFLNIPKQPIMIKKFLSRHFSAFFVSVGFGPFIAPYVTVHLSPIELFRINSMNFAWTESVYWFYTTIFITMPIVIAILSIGWTFEDAGLVRYWINNNKRDFFEIEPIHYKFNSFSKG